MSSAPAPRNDVDRATDYVERLKTKLVPVIDLLNAARAEQGMILNFSVTVDAAGKSVLGPVTVDKITKLI